MATTIILKNGLAANLPVLTTGEPAFTTDTQKLYVGDAGTNVMINPLSEAQATSIQNTIAGLGTASTKDTGTSAGNVPILGTGGKLDPAVIPSYAITQTYVVADQAAMLALAANVGDVCVITGEQKSYILQATPASVLSNWVWLEAPGADVISVNGYTGAVVLKQSDLDLTGYTAPAGTTFESLLATDNGLEAFTKLMNDAMYLNTTKAPLASPALTGTPTAPTATLGTNTTQIATTQFVQSALSNYSTTNPGNFVKTVNTIAPVSGNVTLGGANISLTGYTTVSSYTAPVATMTVNQAIANLAYGVENVDGGTF